MKAVKIGKITRLVNLVDVRLFGRKVDVLADFVADIAQERVVNQVLDDGVLVARILSEGTGCRLQCSRVRLRVGVFVGVCL